MGKDRQFYGFKKGPLLSSLLLPAPETEEQKKFASQMAIYQQQYQKGIAQIQGNHYATGIDPIQTTAELEHELAIKKAKSACAFLERITMITREEKASYQSMLISKDHDSNVLAIAIIDEKVSELTDLVQMYQSGVAPQPEIKT